MSMFIPNLELSFSAANLLITSLAASLLYIFVSGIFLNPTCHIPGPLLTRFTTLSFYHRIVRGSLGSDLVDLHKKYGKFITVRLIVGPVVRLGPNHVDVQRHEIAQNAWGGQNEARQPRHKDPLLGKLARFGLKVDNLVTLAGPREALRMRRLIGGPFSRKFLLDQRNIFMGCVKSLLETIDQVSDGPGVEVLMEFRKYTLDVVSKDLVACLLILAQFSYGGYFKVKPSSVIERTDDIIIANTVFALSPMVLNILKKIPLRATRFSHGLDEIYQDYKSHDKLSSRKDSLGQLLAARDENGVPLTQEELVAAGLVFMIVGGDSTAVALMYISYQLAKDQDLCNRLYNELSTFTMEDLNLNELEKLPLFNAVLFECLRLYPPVPIPTGRICPPQGITIERRFIPGGVNVCHSIFPVCRDPIIFPDPDVFKPEKFLLIRACSNDRWLCLRREEQSKLFENTMIFGYGPRICLGKELAIAALLLKYESWSGLPDKPGSWDEEMKPYDAIVLTPRNRKCVLKFEPRT